MIPLKKGSSPLRHKDTKLQQVNEGSMLSALCSFVPSCLSGDRLVFQQPRKSVCVVCSNRLELGVVVVAEDVCTFLE